MRNLVMLEHVSLDGFVAGPQGEMDWIGVDEEMFDYTARLTDAADTAVYGRVTYQMMAYYWPTAADNPDATRHDVDHARWVNAATKIVVSRTAPDISWPGTRLVAADVERTFETLKQQAGKDLLLIGSPGLAQTLLRADLVDQFWINVNPVVLGAGIPLFGPDLPRLDLELLDSRVFASGVIGLHYRRVRA